MKHNNQNNVTGKEERQLIGGILCDDQEEFDPAAMRSMLDQSRGGQSAPPGLLANSFNKSEFSDQPNLLSDKEYYDYYKNAKNPRLPQPTYNPSYAAQRGDDEITKQFEKLSLDMHRSQTQQQQPPQVNDLNPVSQPQQDFQQGNFNGSLLPQQQQQFQQPQQQQQQQQQQQPFSLLNQSLGGQQDLQTSSSQGGFPIPQSNNQFFDQNMRPSQPQAQTFQSMNLPQPQIQKPFHNQQFQQPYQQNQDLGMMNFGQTNLLNNQQQHNQFSQQMNQQHRPYHHHQNHMQQGGGYQKNHRQMNNNNYNQMNYNNQFQNPNMYQQGQQQNMGFQQGNFNQPMMYNQNYNNNKFYQNKMPQQKNQYNQNNKFYNKNQQNKGKFNNNNHNMGGGMYNNQPNQNQQISLQDLMQNLLQNCKDQQGSRQIQKHFESANITQKQDIFNRVQPEIMDLVKNQFGNYVIQKFLEQGTEEIKNTVFDQLKNNISILSFDTYGCRVIQKALEQFKDNDEKQDQMIFELNQSIKKCIVDQNGNHVIQKCFETTPPSKLKDIISEVIQDIKKLSTHSYGCRVIQRILEFCQPDQVEETALIYDKLMENLINLCECQYGNYIIQYILDKGPEDNKRRIFNFVKEQFVYLSLNKFASNVTEKSVSCSDSNFKRDVLEVLLRLNDSTQETGLIKLTKDSYGNFVIQKLYTEADQDTKNKMYDYLKSEIVFNELSKNNYGKHVIMFIDKQRQQPNSQPNRLQQ